MLTWKGTRRTPKEMAACLIWSLLEELPADWTPAADVTASERSQVEEQVRKLQARILVLLHPDARRHVCASCGMETVLNSGDVCSDCKEGEADAGSR